MADKSFPGIGASQLTDLTDFPSDYTGQGGKFLRVKVTEDGIEFVTGSGGGVAGQQGDIDITALVTTSDGDKAITFTVASAPIDGSYIMVDVNGKLEAVGDGVKTKSFYFSGDSGVTARNFDSSGPNGKVTIGDELFFNGSLAGYQLDTSDKIAIYSLI